LLQPRIDLQVDRDIDGLPYILAGYSCTVTAHERGGARADALGEVAAHLHVLDQQGRIPEMVVRVPDRHFLPDRCPHVKNRLDLVAGHSERNDALAVTVHDGHDIRARLVERAVDESLEIRRAAARIDWRAVESELHDVVALDAI